MVLEIPVPWEILQRGIQWNQPKPKRDAMCTALKGQRGIVSLVLSLENPNITIKKCSCLCKGRRRGISWRRINEVGMRSRQISNVLLCSHDTRLSSQ